MLVQVQNRRPAKEGISKAGVLKYGAIPNQTRTTKMKQMKSALGCIIEQGYLPGGIKTSKS